MESKGVFPELLRLCGTRLKTEQPSTKAMTKASDISSNNSNNNSSNLMIISEMLGLGELRTSLLYRRLVAEALGTAVLVIISCGSALTVTPAFGPSVLSIAIASGLTVATVIWSVGSVSGAHINPCVTIAMLVTHKIRLTRCVAYVILQCVGATAGAAILWGLTPSHRRGTLGVTLMAEEVTVWQGLLVEAIATFVMVLTISATCDLRRADHNGSAALSIGLVVTIDSIWAFQYTGASMNPARSLGPCLITGLWQDHWVFWVGPIMGALPAALLYHWVLDTQRWAECGEDRGGGSRTWDLGSSYCLEQGPFSWVPSHLPLLKNNSNSSSNIPAEMKLLDCPA